MKSLMSMLSTWFEAEVIGKGREKEWEYTVGFMVILAIQHVHPWV